MSTPTAEQFVRQAGPENSLPGGLSFFGASAVRDLPELAHRFAEDGYVLVKRFLCVPLLAVAYRYLWLSLQTGRGNWDDTRLVGTMSLYGDCLLECILEFATPAVESIASRKLRPGFAYGRLNKHGDVLERHRDRSACKISAILSLGHEVGEVRKTRPGYVWPMFMNGNPVACEPGDMIVFRACEVWHSREAFEGRSQAQVSLHYLDSDRQATIQTLCVSGSQLSLELLSRNGSRPSDSNA
jgi:hypothetical protein